MQITKSVSVIIPSFNGKDLIKENLSSVYAALENINSHEIIIVDDASTDDTLEYLEENHPDICVISNTSNLGFSRSVNAGIEAAKYDLLLLLNNDIRLTSDYIMSSLHYFDREDTFGVMGFIRDSEKQDILESIKMPKLSITGLKYTDLHPDNLNISSDLFTMYLCGGNALIDRQKIKNIGGFSLQYEPFYLEDVDISLRAWLSGWKLFFNPKVVCYHEHSATIKKFYTSDFINTISKRNRLRLNYIFLTGIEKRIFLAIARIKLTLYEISHSFKIKSSYHGYRQFFNTRAELQPFASSNSNKLKKIFSIIYYNLEKSRMNK